jgi:putative phosphoesterase
MDDIRKEGIDNFIVLGDLVMVGPAPRSVMCAVHSLNPICWIKGNTDMWFEEMSSGWEPKTSREQQLFRYYQFAESKISKSDINFLSNLPIKKSVRVVDTDILCVHGSPRSVIEIMDDRVPIDEMKKMVEEVDETIVLCGHSHFPYIGLIRDKHIFNVGSVGRPLDGNFLASYGILDLSCSSNPKCIIRRINYPVNKTIGLARESGFPNLDAYEFSLLNARLP